MSRRDDLDEYQVESPQIFSNDGIERVAPLPASVAAAIQQSLRAVEQVAEVPPLNLNAVGTNRLAPGTAQTGSSHSLFVIEDYYFDDEDEDEEPKLEDGFAFSTFSEKNLQSELFSKWVTPIHNILDDMAKLVKEQGS